MGGGQQARLGPRSLLRSSAGVPRRLDFLDQDPYKVLSPTGSEILESQGWAGV